jgi:hypothetical protein
VHDIDDWLQVVLEAIGPDRGATIGSALVPPESAAPPTSPRPRSLEKTIADGVPRPKNYGSPMPPMGGAELSPSQVSAVAAYVWALGHRGGK